MHPRGDGPPLIGRERELAGLRAHLQHAGQGQGGFVLVTGEAGAGKTRLLAELGREAEAAGWRVLHGRAYEAEGTPYLPFAEALGEYSATCPVERLHTQLGAGAADVALLVPAVRRRLPALAPPAPEQNAYPPIEAHTHYRLFEAIADFIAAVAQAAAPGVLLLLDDLHWADPPSLRLLLHLGRRLERMPVLVAAASRLPEGSGSHPLTGIFAALRRERLGERLDLATLSRDAVATLVETISGRAPATAVAAALYEQTNGNAFFLLELVRHLQAEGHDLSDAAVAGEAWRVPVGVREVIRARLARLSPEANRLLQASAVMGEGVRFDVLGDAAGIAPLTLLDAIDEVAAAGILREEQDAYYFSHALIRQAVHDEISAPRRQHLHMQAAAAIERLYARDLPSHLPALAQHYRLAGPGATEQALAYSRQAGEAAMHVFAWEAAIQHWQAALALLGPGGAEERCETLLLLAEAQNRAGDRAAAQETCHAAGELARGLGSGELLARAALGYAGSWVVFSRLDDTSVALMEEALAALGEENSALRCRLMARLAIELTFTGAEARRDALTADAVAGARNLGDLTALVQALSARHTALDAPDRLADRLAITDELVALATTARDKQALALGLSLRFATLMEAGKIALADVELEAYTALAHELQQPLIRWRAAMWRAMRALLDGRFEDAERLMVEARQLGQRAQDPDTYLVYIAQRQILRRQRGMPEQQAPDRSQAEREPSLTPRVPDGWIVRLALDMGRREDAQASLDRVAAGEFTGLPGGAGYLPNLALLAETCAELGDRRNAAPLYARMEQFATRLVATTGISAHLGVADYYLARLATILERWQEAEQHFQAADALHRRLGARAFLAQTWFEHGRMLLARGRPGDRERAVQLVADARVLAEEIGMAPLAQAATQLALPQRRSQSGSTARGTVRERPPLPDGLTPREAEVLRLIAGGRTTKEVAAELVVAVDTVHRHIANLYAKIGARGRADAAAYAIAHGLIDTRQP